MSIIIAGSQMEYYLFMISHVALGPTNKKETWMYKKIYCIENMEATMLYIIYTYYVLYIGVHRKHFVSKCKKRLYHYATRFSDPIFFDVG